MKISRLKIIANSCFPGANTPLFINHSGENPMNARTYLLSQDAPRSLVNRLFTNNGTWRYYPKQPQLYSLDPGTLNRRLRALLKPIYELINYSLDGSFEHGFNRHDQNHVDAVTLRAIHLLKQAKADEQRLRRVIISCRAHDLGNLLSRKAHSLLSSTILATILPILTKDQKQWKDIQRSIELHEEPVLDSFLRSIRASSGASSVRALRRLCPPETLALIIADKTQIGRDRISFKTTSKSALDIDPHIEVNLLGTTTLFSITRSSALWEIQFTPHLTKDEQRLYQVFKRNRSHHTGTRAHVSNNIQTRHRFPLPVPHFDSWRHLFWKIYMGRTMLLVQSTFALFQNIQSFNIIMRDSVAPGSRAGETVIQTFERSLIDEHFSLLQLKHVPKEERHNGKNH